VSGHTRLIVRDFRVSMAIGIFECDRDRTEPLLINMEVDVRLPENWQADSYDRVLGYDKLVDMARKLTSSGHLNLVETLAEKLAEGCFAWPQVEKVKIRIEKPEIFDDCVVGVEISRKRG